MVLFIRVRPGLVSRIIIIRESMTILFYGIDEPCSPEVVPRISLFFTKNASVMFFNPDGLGKAYEFECMQKYIVFQRELFKSIKPTFKYK